MISAKKSKTCIGKLIKIPFPIYRYSDFKIVLDEDSTINTVFLLTDFYTQDEYLNRLDLEYCCEAKYSRFYTEVEIETVYLQIFAKGNFALLEIYHDSEIEVLDA
jgi:hypothetical protein